MPTLRRRYWITPLLVCLLAQAVFAQTQVSLTSLVRMPMTSAELQALDGSSGLIIRLAPAVQYSIDPPLVLTNCILLGNGAAITCTSANRRAPDDIYNYALEVHSSLVADLRLDVAGNAMTGLMLFGSCQLRGHNDVRGYWGKAIGVSHGNVEHATVTIDDVYCETDQATVAEAGGVQIDWGSKIGRSATVGRVVVGPIKTRPPVALKQKWAMKIACCEHTVVADLDAGDGGIVFGEGVGYVEIHVRNLQMSNLHPANPTSDPAYPSDFPKVAFMPSPGWWREKVRCYPERLVLYLEDPQRPALLPEGEPK